MKVFISSTYKDLIDYRAAAIRAVEGTNYQASKMEVFGARPDEPLAACLDEVAESDFFLGIYAHRYGYIPAGSEISITEMEYVQARKLGKTIYCFVVDEENQPWLPKFIEGEPGQAKLKDFKRRIQTDHICAFFTSPSDLGMKVANALSHYVANHHEAEAPINHSPIPSRCSTLPTQPYFFGRVEELKTIAGALSPDSRTWGALIDGPGGIGKTALAIKAAHDAPAELFERKIFITAKVRELTAEGEAKLTDFTRPTYLAMLDELGKELGEDGLEKLAPDDRPNELRLALAGKKALIIFDNLETLPEEERTRLFQFISRLPEGNKAIVTSRRRSDVDARIVRLDRLSHDEALQLIEELAKKYPRLQRESKAEQEKLYEITQGNPLFIRWIAGQLGREGSQCRTIAGACAFIDQAPKGNDPLEYIFGDLLETFSPDETKILAALTYFSLPAKLQWIADMTNLPTRAAETALEDLTDRSILTSDLPKQTYFLPPLTAKFIRTHRPEAVTQTGDVLANRAYSQAMKYGGYKHETFTLLNDEWALIEPSFELLSENNDKRFQRLVQQLTKFFEYTGRWDEWLQISEQAEIKAVNSKDFESAGWRVFSQGWIHYLRGDSEKVQKCSKRLAKYSSNQGEKLQSANYRLQGLGFILEKNYADAIKALNETWKIRNAKDPESKGTASSLNELADVYLMNGDYEEAENNIKEALRISEKIGNKEGVATYTGNLALLYITQEKWETAASVAEEALAIAEEMGQQEIIAQNCHRLANTLLHQNHLDIALQYAERAVKMMNQLHYKDLSASQKLLEEIQLIRNQDHGADH